MNPTGSGRLVPSSAGGSPFSQVGFFPFNGNTITIDGMQHVIPDAGVRADVVDTYVNGVAGQNLAANTLYLVYCFVLNGVLKLGYSTGAQALGTGGIEVISGHNDWTLIGLVRTDANGKFLCDAANQTTASWYNRVRIGLKKNISNCYTSSTVWTEPNSTNRISLVCWADDIPDVELSGVMSNNTQYGRVWAAIGVDGSTTTGSSIASWDCLSPTCRAPFYSKESSSGGMNGGYHYFTVLMKVSAGSGSLVDNDTQLTASPVPS